MKIMILIVAALTSASEIIMASVFCGSTRKAVAKTTDRITRHNHIEGESTEWRKTRERCSKIR